MNSIHGRESSYISIPPTTLCDFASYSRVFNVVAWTGEYFAEFQPNFEDHQSEIMTGGGFEQFLQTKIHVVNSNNEADHVIRRAFSTFRLHFEEISDGIDQVDQRLCEVLGKEWKTEYESRNNELPRMDKSNMKSKRSS